MTRKQSSTHRRAIFRVQVQPRASKTEVVGRHGDAIKIRIQAPPVDGAANAELIRFLATELGTPRAAVRVTRGASGRSKWIEVAGLDPSEVEQLLGLG